MDVFPAGRYEIDGMLQEPTGGLASAKSISDACACEALGYRCLPTQVHSCSPGFAPLSACQPPYRPPNSPHLTLPRSTATHMRSQSSPSHASQLSILVEPSTSPVASWFVAMLLCCACVNARRMQNSRDKRDTNSCHVCVASVLTPMLVHLRTHARGHASARRVGRATHLCISARSMRAHTYATCACVHKTPQRARTYTTCACVHKSPQRAHTYTTCACVHTGPLSTNTCAARRGHKHAPEHLQHAACAHHADKARVRV
eukprot:14595259-Alexandrium_andersonii.AAC.1